MSQGAQNKKTGLDALGTVENDYGCTKRGQTPSVWPKTSPREQNMKKGPDALGTAENMSRSRKHENRTRRLR
jgi:hypothetical protein